MKTHAAIVGIAVACTMLAAAAPADAQGSSAAERVEPFTHLTGPRVELGDGHGGRERDAAAVPQPSRRVPEVLGIHDLLRGQVPHTALSPTVVTRIAETPATTRERHRANEYGGLQTVGQVQGTTLPDAAEYSRTQPAAQILETILDDSWTPRRKPGHGSRARHERRRVSGRGRARPPAAARKRRRERERARARAGASRETEPAGATDGVDPERSVLPALFRTRKSGSPSSAPDTRSASRTYGRTT